MVLLDFGPIPANYAVPREKVFQVALKPWRPTHRGSRSMCRCHVPRCLFLIHTNTWAKMKFRSRARRGLTASDGIDTDMFLGDALLTRNPPTDTRKVKAGYKPQLANYTDVIVCSVKGHRRLADWLAGGDYDGDKGSFFCDPTPVKPFATRMRYFRMKQKTSRRISRRKHEPELMLW
ncbi:hypothetical protein FIBSPDRAFT_1047826, partial [Athelia psychrophila]